MVKRVYVEKKPGFDLEAQALTQELRDILEIKGLESARLINCYDVEGVSEELFERSVHLVFAEPQTDTASFEFVPETGEQVFAVEYLPGQFDARAESASECIQLISQGERPLVRSVRIYVLSGELEQDDLRAIKQFLINPVEAREATLELPETLALELEEPADVEVLNDFCEFDELALADFVGERGLAMDLADAQFCQDYFRNEGRPPTITEIRVMDTYWSDHCRHTTFGTELTHIDIDDEVVQAAFKRYLELRQELGRDERPITLMDMATIGAKYLVHTEQLKNLDESEEINACTVKVKVDVNGKDEDWLFLFKNETHNHPTEIEPFGGAATCIGGAIRDPLSGRSYVYQAMRVTGAADPTVAVSKTRAGKLPQRKLVTGAAQGYSSYGNQIGLATSQVSELYHPGYEAKRMEIGAVVGATPAKHVRREVPAPGDVVVLLGGRTGRDGIGGATGSSKAHKESSLTSCGAEVQKGNPPIERKLQRLFRREDACKLIKRCNDFGAGGVSVAVGELAVGLLINLDAIPKKYEGLDGTELAISESQERMAVVLDPKDVEHFIELAHEENLEAHLIAEVSLEPRLKMVWRDKTIVDVSREFLSSNGAPKHQDVHVEVGGEWMGSWEGTSFAEKMKSLVSDLNVACNKGLAERFDSTIGAASVLMPFGGKTQLTPASAMVAKLPVFGETTTCSGLAWGFNPYLMEQNQFTGAYLSVIESVSKLVSAGFKHEDAYLTFQEFFERLRDVPERWGKPAAALLGALMAQLDLGIGAIGGKDSMSGSFEDLDVPPTLVSFATALGKTAQITSPEFKGAGHPLLVLIPSYGPDGITPEPQSLLDTLSYIENLIGQGRALAVGTPGYGGMAEALFKATLGNTLGVSVLNNFSQEALFCPAYGSFYVELETLDNLPVPSERITVAQLGSTCSTAQFAACGEVLDLEELTRAWKAPLAEVFPFEGEGAQVDTISFDADEKQGVGRGVQTVEKRADTTLGVQRAEQQNYNKYSAVFAGKDFAKPRVLIPVFPGTNCEYDSAAAFERAGAAPETFIINNLSPDAIAQSTEKLAEAIEDAQIVMLPGGFSGGDEPDGSAKFICALFRAPAVTEAVRRLLNERDGLILGICNGFQALVKLGLVPYGDIVEMDDTCPTLTFNTIGRHQSSLVTTRVASTLSPWLSRCEVGDEHLIAISHGEGRFVASEKLLQQLKAQGQIATQYVGLDGKPSMDLLVNPNGSVLSIEGITSADGRIMGKMGHSERAGTELYKNVPGNKYQPLFEGGVNYFAL